jgi:hypothetical protein
MLSLLLAEHILVKVVTVVVVQLCKAAEAQAPLLIVGPVLQVRAVVVALAHPVAVDT